ncbi:Ankyrin repeat and death domain-containing protein 1A, partial [Lecanicillium sp. MT-2017a]
LSDRRDVNVFARSCRGLYALLNPYLYRLSALHDNHALLWAAEKGMETTARLAIWYGANVNATVCSHSPIIVRSPTVPDPSGDYVKTESNKLEGYTPLLLAIWASNTNVVRLLLDRKDVDVNKENVNKINPLKLALVQNRTEILPLLLRHSDVDINHTSLEIRRPGYSVFAEPPLTVAVREENIECIQLLLAHEKIDVNRRGVGSGTALHKACQMSNQRIAKMLLSHPETDINAKRTFALSEYSAFDWAVQLEEDWGFARLLLQYEALDRCAASLHLAGAAIEGYDDTVDLLLPHADASVLILAAQGAGEDEEQERAEELVRRLLEREDININAVDHRGRTALHWAALSGSTTTVEMLLDDDRIMTNLKDVDGYTPLHAAVLAHQGYVYNLVSHDRDFLGVIELLMDDDDVDESPLNMTNDWGMTVLHDAAARGHCCLVRRLLEVGSIDPNLREDGEDATPVLLAVAEGQTKTALLLLRSKKVVLTPGDIARLT